MGHLGLFAVDLEAMPDAEADKRLRDSRCRPVYFLAGVSVHPRKVLAGAESDTPRAVQLRDEFRTAVHELIAPDLFPPELAHALTRAERQGRIDDAVTRLIDVLTTSPSLTRSLPMLLRAAGISSTLRIGVYDCRSVALVERERREPAKQMPLPIVSADGEDEEMD